MMFQSVGHRPRTQQRVRLGATPDGKLVSLMHDSLNHTSILDDYSEGCSEATAYSYSTPNLRATSGLVRRNVGTPTSMRGPGAVPGLFALESAMDELAIKLNMDPVKLRLLNEPQKDEGTEPAFLFAPHGRVSERRRGKIWLVAAHAAGRLDEEGRLDSGLGSRRLLLDCRAHGHRSQRWTCATTAPPASPAPRRILAPAPTPSFRRSFPRRPAFPTTRSKSFSATRALPPGPISGGSWATASVIPASSRRSKRRSRLSL